MSWHARKDALAESLVLLARGVDAPSERLAWEILAMIPPTWLLRELLDDIPDILAASGTPHTGAVLVDQDRRAVRALLRKKVPKETEIPKASRSDGIMEASRVAGYLRGVVITAQAWRASDMDEKARREVAWPAIRKWLSRVRRDRKRTNPSGPSSAT